MEAVALALTETLSVRQKFIGYVGIGEALTDAHIVVKWQLEKLACLWWKGMVWRANNVAELENDNVTIVYEMKVTTTMADEM
jgi:hypothetical protein